MPKNPEDPSGLVGSESLDLVLSILLQRAMAVTAADRGNVQLFSPRVQGLTIAAQKGFDQAFLSHFALVGDDGSACGRAATALSQVVIEDVQTDDAFAPHRDVSKASGFSAVQSTPLVGADGSLVGMVSTHFAQPHRPSTDQLELLESYGKSYGVVLSDLIDATTQPAIEVLVVEDDDAVRSSLAVILATAGYRVVEARDGIEALTHLASSDVGMMLLDIDMPRLDGIALLERLNSVPPTIVISGNGHKMQTTLSGSKVQEYVTKPFAPRAVLSRVSDVLGAAS